MFHNHADHFAHILEHLFVPALEKAGFEPIPPKATGSDIIQAEIINQLSSSDLVLCDMSILNPNVFYEFGIRTALDKPVALVVDDKTKNVPFDTSIINFHRYDSSLNIWRIKDEIDNLAKHTRASFKKANNRNSLWKYFGIAQTGIFKPEESTIGEKIDLLRQEVGALKNQAKNEPVSFKSLFPSGISNSDSPLLKLIKMDVESPRLDNEIIAKSLIDYLKELRTGSQKPKKTDKK